MPTPNASKAPDVRPWWFVRPGCPVARQRWNRFRNHRRAFISAWLLLLLFAISLAADLLCNDKPLYLRFNGKSYVPFLTNYPASEFTPGAPHTTPDYRALAATAAFAAGKGNRIVFAPVPYGAKHVADDERVRLLSGTPVFLTPVPRVCSVNMATNLVIARTTAAQGFFADGMAEDIIAALSQISTLAVVARNSSFAYKDRAVKVQDIAKTHLINWQFLRRPVTFYQCCVGREGDEFTDGIAGAAQLVEDGAQIVVDERATWRQSGGVFRGAQRLVILSNGKLVAPQFPMNLRVLRVLPGRLFKNLNTHLLISLKSAGIAIGDVIL